MVDRLRFGTAGIPKAVTGNIFKAIPWIQENGFGCTELEFVHSTWLKEEAAERLKEETKKADVHLTAHGSYYINLNAKEPEKRGASRARVMSAAHALDRAGGKSVTFHPAFYLKQDPKLVYENVKKQMRKILDEVNEHSLQIRLSPETTGKPTQFGSIQELTQLAADFSGEIGLCVDFAHLHARTNGKYNTYEEFNDVLALIEEKLGKEGLQTMHIHLSGIAYGEKGEKHHLMLKESDFNLPDLLRAWKEYKIKGWVICESPIMEEDAAYMQTEYNNL